MLDQKNSLTYRTKSQGILQPVSKSPDMMMRYEDSQEQRLNSEKRKLSR